MEYDTTICEADIDTLSRNNYDHEYHPGRSGRRRGERVDDHRSDGEQDV